MLTFYIRSDYYKFVPKLNSSENVVRAPEVHVNYWPTFTGGRRNSNVCEDWQSSYEINGKGPDSIRKFV